MKNFKIPLIPLWISLGIFVVVLMPYIEKHSGFFQFLTSLILVGVTASYVWLTYKILKTQEIDLEMKKKYIIVPDILEVKKRSSNILKLNCVIKNVSAYPASELSVFIVGFRNTGNGNFKHLVGHYAIPAIAPQETIEFKPHGLYPPEFGDETLEKAMDSYKFPEEVKKKILQEYILTEKFKRDITGENTIAVIFLAISFRTVYNATKFLARDFLIYETYKKTREKIRITSNTSVEYF